MNQVPQAQHPPNRPEGDFPHRTVDFDLLRYRSTAELDVRGLALSDVQFRAELEDARRRLTCQMSATLLGKTHGVEAETVRWPNGPWEAFKAKYAPRWWRDRWPVRYAEKTLVAKVTMVCPHHGTRFSDDQHHVTFLLAQPTNFTGPTDAS